MWPFLLANQGWKCELGAMKGLNIRRASEFQQACSTVHARTHARTHI